jgi:mRNA deadenylase 3'-5' endonuclease subunit Ccr4
MKLFCRWARSTSNNRLMERVKMYVLSGPQTASTLLYSTGSITSVPIYARSAKILLFKISSDDILCIAFYRIRKQAFRFILNTIKWFYSDYLRNTVSSFTSIRVSAVNLPPTSGKSFGLFLCGYFNEITPSDIADANTKTQWLLYLLSAKTLSKRDFAHTAY